MATTTNRQAVTAQQRGDGPKLQEISGKIIAIDHLRGFMTLDRQPGPVVTMQRMLFAITPETRVMKDDVRLTVEDLQVSPDSVTVQYLMQASPPLAQAVTLETPLLQQRVAGTVEVVDLVRGRLVVRSGRPPGATQAMTLAVDERTLCSQGGHRAYLMSLRPGTDVMAEYELREGVPTARTIRWTNP
jgi:hypothetical protein